MSRVTALILVVLLLTSCSKGKGSLSQSVNTIENTQVEFRINNKNQGITYTDFDEIYLLSKSFLNEFYGATISKERVNLEPYINNENFKKYIQQKIEAGSKGSVNKVKKLVFGTKDIEWHLKEGYIFINLVVEVEQEVGGFGEEHQFLISNKDGRLVISDWYSKSAGSVSYFDEIARGKIDKIENPEIWNNKVKLNSGGVFTPSE